MQFELGLTSGSDKVDVDPLEAFKQSEQVDPDAGQACGLVAVKRPCGLELAMCHRMVVSVIILVRVIVVVGMMILVRLVFVMRMVVVMIMRRCVALCCGGQRRIDIA